MWRFLLLVASTFLIGFLALAIATSARSAEGMVQISLPIFGNDCVASQPGVKFNG